MGGFFSQPGQRGNCGDLQKYGIKGWESIPNCNECASRCEAQGVCNSYKCSNDDHLCCLYAESSPNVDVGHNLVYGKCSYGTCNDWSYCSKHPAPKPPKQVECKSDDICHEDVGPNSYCMDDPSKTPPYYCH